MHQEQPSPDSPFLIPIPLAAAGIRLDVFLASRFVHCSRSSLVHQIQQGAVQVNGQNCKAGYRLKPDDLVSGILPSPQQTTLTAEEVFFDILWEDDDLLVLSKPPGVVVHPAAGNRTGTLAQGLVFHNKKIADAGDAHRPGLVHRLDKDTSGVMVTAKNDAAHRALVRQFKERKIQKTYRAIVDGVPAPRGAVDVPIGRHPVSRQKMAAGVRNSKPASTTWNVLEKLHGNRTYIELKPVTGRTHQLRVHMAYCKTPICGDTLYGRKKNAEACGCARQMLHAYTLLLRHPTTERWMEFTAPLWPDMAGCLAALRVGSEEDAK